MFKKRCSVYSALWGPKLCRWMHCFHPTFFKKSTLTKGAEILPFYPCMCVSVHMSNNVLDFVHVCFTFAALNMFNATLMHTHSPVMWSVYLFTFFAPLNPDESESKMNVDCRKKKLLLPNMCPVWHTPWLNSTNPINELDPINCDSRTYPRHEGKPPPSAAAPFFQFSRMSLSVPVINEQIGVFVRNGLELGLMSPPGEPSPVYTAPEWWSRKRQSAALLRSSSPFFSLSPSLWFSLSRSGSLSLSLSRSISFSLAISLLRSFSLTFSLCVALSRCISVSLPLSLCLSLAHGVEVG